MNLLIAISIAFLALASHIKLAGIAASALMQFDGRSLIRCETIDMFLRGEGCDLPPLSDHQSYYRFGQAPSVICYFVDELFEENLGPYLDQQGELLCN